MPTPTGALCATHPTVAAVDACERCGSYVCGECLEFTNDAVRCKDCFARDRQKPSNRAIWALVLSVVGIQCGLLPGIAGLILGTQELAAIERGEAPTSGKSLARGAQIIGAIDVGLLIIALLAVAGGIAYFFMKGH